MEEKNDLEEKQVKKIEEDIKRIKEAIKDKDDIIKAVKKNDTTDKKNPKYQELLDLFINLDALYQEKIKNWCTSMYSCFPEFGFQSDWIGIEPLIRNLMVASKKLEGLLLEFNSNIDKQTPYTITNTNINTNNIEVYASFEKAINNIEGSNDFDDKEKKELKEKVEELENIINSKKSKNDKWESAKNILHEFIDKGFDAGITLLPYLINMLK